MTATTILEYALWLLAPSLQLWIVAVMTLRRLYRDFPIFFAYCVFHVVQVVIAIASRQHSYLAYFLVYWGSELIDVPLELLVIQEIFWNVFRDYDALRKASLLLFRCATVFMALIALFAAIGAPGNDSDHLIRALLVLQRSVRLVQSGVLVFLFLLRWLFGLNWRSYAFGIAIGFAMLAITSTVAAALRSQLGEGGDPAYSNYLYPATYNGAILVWLYYMWRPSIAPIKASLPSSDELRAWNRTLQRFLRA
jgi:hypothetical protein